MRDLTPEEKNLHWRPTEQPTTPEMAAKVMRMVLQGLILIVGLGALALSALLMVAVVWAVFGALFGNA